MIDEGQEMANIASRSCPVVNRGAKLRVDSARDSAGNLEAQTMLCPENPHCPLALSGDQEPGRLSAATLCTNTLRACPSRCNRPSTSSNGASRSTPRYRLYTSGHTMRLTSPSSSSRVMNTCPLAVSHPSRSARPRVGSVTGSSGTSMSSPFS